LGTAVLYVVRLLTMPLEDLRFLFPYPFLRSLRLRPLVVLVFGLVF
jgi:hypothetical protein